MKILVFFFGLGLVTAALFILKFVAKNLPDIGVLDALMGLFALSLLSGGVRMIWASFFLP